MKPPEESLHWQTVIRPRSGMFRFNFIELWRYRDLVFSFVKRDFVAFYKQTFLGPLWYLIQPLASSLILYIVFTRIARLPTGGVPPFIFYLSGNLLWIYFSENIIRTSETFVQNAKIFGKVYFPRLAVPVSVSISGLISLAIQFGLFLIFYVQYVMDSGITIHWSNFAFLPLVILQLIIGSFSIGLLISALTTKYRDLSFTLKFGIQLWMFASPIAYDAGQVPRQYLDLYMVNPVAPAIEGFRYAFFGHTNLDSSQLILTGITTICLFFLSVIVFNRVEKTFIDNV